MIATYSGDYGKPRPGVIVQASAFNQSHETVVLCPITSHLTGLSMFRVPLARSAATGLHQDSEIMVDKITVSKRQRIRQRVGRLSAEQLGEVNAALRTWLDLPESAPDYKK